MPETTITRRSAAMARRLRAQLQDNDGQTLPDELLHIVNDFRPQGPLASNWTTVRPAVVGTLAGSTVRGEATFRKHITHLGYFLAWAHDQGLPLSPTILVRDHVDEYTRVGMPNATAKSRADRRSRLRWLADQVNPEQAPDKGVPIERRPVKPPYSSAELASIARVARTQPTAAQRRNLSACVALGAGAGLDSGDLRHLRAGHVVDKGADGLLVQVPGSTPRLVPVLACWEQLLREALDGRDAEQLVLGRKQDRRNIAARAVTAAVVLADCPHIEQGRLRSTWLTVLMRQRVPLGTIMRAAGLRSPRTLGDLLPFAGPPSPEDMRLLRGQGWTE